MAALVDADGARGCALATPAYRRQVIDHEVGWKRVGPGASCAEAFTSHVTSERELGKSFDVVAITRTRTFEKTDRAYYEIQWAESEEGDGSGYTLAWRDGHYLIDVSYSSKK